MTKIGLLLETLSHLGEAGTRPFSEFLADHPGILDSAKASHKAASTFAAAVLREFGFKRGSGITYGKGGKQLDMWVGFNGRTKVASVWLRIGGKKQSFPLASEDAAAGFYRAVSGV